MMEPLLEVSNLTVDYILSKRRLRALRRVNFSLERGEVMGVAGESGCGKSTLGLAVIRLLPKIADVRRGEILFEGRDLLKLNNTQMDQEIRGQKISMIFQNPQNALNPVFTVGRQIKDVLYYQSRYHGRPPVPSELKRLVVEKLRETGIAAPEERLSNYPFEFSGGMKQRVMIAMALSSQTSLLVADEPTTALDVTIEAQILELIKNLTRRYGTSILYISHDLGVLSEISTRLMIMYAGSIFELGPTEAVLDQPRHPYSAALLESLPGKHEQSSRLLSIPGQVPALDQLPIGCTFHPRCPFAEDQCMEKDPPLIEVTPNHWSACLLDQQRGRRKWTWT